MIEYFHFHAKHVCDYLTKNLSNNTVKLWENAGKVSFPFLLYPLIGDAKPYHEFNKVPLKGILANTYLSTHAIGNQTTKNFKIVHFKLFSMYCTFQLDLPHAILLLPLQHKEHLINGIKQ